MGLRLAQNQETEEQIGENHWSFGGVQFRSVRAIGAQRTERISAAGSIGVLFALLAKKNQERVRDRFST